MDNATAAAIEGLQRQVNVLAMAVGQCLALLAAPDEAMASELDNLLTQIDARFLAPESNRVTNVMRDGHDQMAARARAIRARRD